MDPMSRPLVDLGQPPAPVEGLSSSGVEGLRKKDVKRLLDMSRPLDAWERYRALNDAMDEVYDVIDMSIREARFALLLMGGLNAVVIVAATRSDLVAVLQPQQRTWAASLLAIYGVCAVYFLLQAIEALRPGKFRPHFGDWSETSEDFPRRVRYYEDVIERDVQAHWHAWREVEVGQLNAELAVQLHSMCIKSNVKRNALRRLYAGLRIMTLLVAALVALFVYATWT
jgi:uncharacterized membrane protein YuzA (DUF378 family)